MMKKTTAFMTIEEYYAEKDKLKVPQDLDFPAERQWILQAKRDLQKRLCKNDLEIVLDNERKWMDKVNSSIS